MRFPVGIANFFSCLEAWLINSALAPLNRDDGGLLPDAYLHLVRKKAANYGRPSPPKIQGCQIDQQIQRWCKDQLQDSIANKGMAWPNNRQSSFPS